jgi:hypothetical protein
MALHEDVASLVARHAETNQKPEAVSVLVDLTVVGGVGGEQVARTVAPMVAKTLYPARAFGEVLHVEPLGGYQYEVAVAVVEPNGIIISRTQNNR